MAKWKDISSYSQTENPRVPKTFELQIRNLRVIVSRHIHYPPTSWLISSESCLFSEYEFKSDDLFGAKLCAMKLLAESLDAMTKELMYVDQTTE